MTTWGDIRLALKNAFIDGWKRDDATATEDDALEQRAEKYAEQAMVALLEHKPVE